MQAAGAQGRPHRSSCQTPRLLGVWTHRFLNVQIRQLVNKAFAQLQRDFQMPRARDRAAEGSRGDPVASVNLIWNLPAPMSLALGS